MRVLLAFALAAGCIGATAGWAQTPAGSEFQINQDTAYSQENPDVAKAPDGSFVVVWNNDRPIARGLLDPVGIRGRRFDSSGSPLTGDFQVHEDPAYYFGRPRIDGGGGGEFVVTWDATLFGDSDDDPAALFSYPTVQMRRLDSSGSPVGAEFQVSTDLYPSYSEYQTGPDVSVDPSGNFVIVWEHSYSDKGGTTTRIRGRRFGSDGNPLGDPFDIDGPDGDFRSDPSVSHDPATGGFAVVWRRSIPLSQPATNAEGIFGRRFDSSGTAIGGEFLVNNSLGTYPDDPRLSHDSAGNFVVAWEEFEYTPQSGNGPFAQDIFARRFDSGGMDLGPQFQVSQNTDFNYRPDLCHDQCGGFVVAWDNGPFKGIDREILARSFASSGAAVGSEMVINSFTTDRQSSAGISHDLASNFVITWESYDQDGSNEGVFGQRFQNSADLGVGMTDMPDPVSAGANITYDIPVTNAGAICSATTLDTSTPTDTTFVSLTVPVAAGPAGPVAGWSCMTPAPGGTGPISCTHPAFFNGDPGMFQLVVNVNPGTPGGTMINAAATVSGATFDPNLMNNAAAAVTIVAAPQQPNLTISKSVDPMGQVFSGDVLTYTIIVQNIGSGAATGVMVQDTVPAMTSYVGGSCTSMPGSCSFADPVVSFNIGTLNPMQSATLTFQVVVDPAPLPPGQIVNDTYSVSSDQTAPVMGDPVINTLVPAELIEFETQ